MSKNITPYLVLARKYRPSSFLSLVGQDPLVRTISNAVKSNRVAHAFLLSGIRGIGKTTTARIIAKTINCTMLNLSQDIIEPCDNCENCLAFKNDRHPDILELDAASKTGVNDIREIIDNANYLPILGKTKVFIIDEVHMLSTNAFNALLKTLEEPPAHVKFIFATTELRKIPITVLSRCQRFDLRRLSDEMMAIHLKNIAEKENIIYEEQAIAIISTNAEGSVRDGLSLLDQAIACSTNNPDQKVTEQTVRDMLGICDKNKLFNLFGFIVTGNAKEAIGTISQLYYEGIDPITLVEDLLELSHMVTKVKLIPELAESHNLPEQDRINYKKFAQQLPVISLTIIWQMLLKGIQEIRLAPFPLPAIEMLIIRLCYSSNLPSPHDVIREIKSNPTSVTKLVPSFTTNVSSSQLIAIETQNQQDAVSSLIINSFQDLVKAFYDKNELIYHHHLMEDVNLVSFTPGNVIIKLGGYAPKELPAKLSNLLSEWTGIKWTIAVNNDAESNPTLIEQKQIVKKNEINQAADIPIVKAVLDNFDGATIIDINKNTQQKMEIT